MASLKRFVECNFEDDSYPCSLPTLERVMGRNGYKLVATERVNYRLVSYYWYNSICDELIEINIYDNARWSPVIRDWSKKDIENILHISL